MITIPGTRYPYQARQVTPPLSIKKLGNLPIGIGKPKILKAKVPSKRWYSGTLTNGTTNWQSIEDFIDEHTGNQFFSVGVIVEADDGNSGNVGYRFKNNGNEEVLGPGDSFGYDNMSEKGIYYKLYTANDTFRVRAW